MVRTASAAAVLVFAAGLASGASAQSPEAAKPPEAAVAVPLATAQAAAPALPSIVEAMRAQAKADAPPPPPPPPAPVAAPSVAVAAAALAPAARTVKFAFAPPPPGAMKAAKAVAAERAEPPPVKVAAAAPKAAAAVIKVAAVAPAPAATPQAAAQPAAQAAAAAPQAAPVLEKAVLVAPAPKPVAAPVPAKASVGPAPSALVARRVTDAAGAFDAWTEKAARIDGKFADASGVSAALTDASAVQAEQLEEGAVAFGALAALQDPVFVQSAHELAAIDGDHDAAAAILLKTPAQVMSLPGANGAAAFAAQALSKRALAVTAAGKSVRQAAYSMQVDPWARTQVPTPEKRLADAKAGSATAIALDGAASGTLMKRLVELRTGRQSVPVAPGAPTPLVTRSLALAAMIVMGEADEAHAAKLVPLLVESKSSDCLKMAKLNFFQCLSAAGPHYEDAFCIGQHGLGETGQCLVAATGVSVAAPAATAPVLIAAAGPAPSAGVSVPIALLAENGPERAAAAAAPVRPVAPAPAPAVPAPPLPAAASMLLAQAAPAPAAVPASRSDQPVWAREPAPIVAAARPLYADEQPRAYARQEAPTAAPRYDRGRAYLWDRQARPADYSAPGYGAAPYGAYAEPRQGYGRYPTQPGRQAYDPRYDDQDDDDAPDAAPAPRAYPQRGYWNDR